MTDLHGPEAWNAAVAGFPIDHREPWPRNSLNHLVLPLAESLNALFETQSWKNDPGLYGSEYFPPNERLRDLLLEALSACAGPVGSFQRQLNSTERVKEFIRYGGELRLRLEAAVWLLKHAPEEFDEAVQGVQYRYTRFLLAAALIELGGSRSSEAERALLQAVEDFDVDTWRDDSLGEIIRLVLRKLDSPESFLDAWCRCLSKAGDDYYSEPLPLKPLILEIIRRRGLDALPQLRRARGLAQGCNQRVLQWATYLSIAELDGLELESDLTEGYLDVTHLLGVKSFDGASLDDFRKYRDALRSWAITFADFLAGRDDVRRYREAMKLPVTMDEFLNDLYYLPAICARNAGWHYEELGAARSSASSFGRYEEGWEPLIEELEGYSDLKKDSPDLDLAWQCLMERLGRILAEAG